MPLQFVWEDEDQTVLRLVFIGHWTLDEFYVCYEELYALYEAVGHPVDLIVDMHTNQTNILPMLSSVQRSERRVHPNHRSVSIIGVNPVIRAFGQAAVRLAPKLTARLYFASDDEDAYRHILLDRARAAAQDGQRSASGSVKWKRAP